MRIRFVDHHPVLCYFLNLLKPTRSHENPLKVDSEKWVKAIESYLHRNTLFVVFIMIHKDAEIMDSYSKCSEKKDSLEGLWTGRKGTETVVVDQENVSCALVDVEVVGVSEAESYSHIWVSAGCLDWTVLL